ncbi:amino acid ABC transporter substrate-binding protein [Nostoc linckia FACHB-104]|nr:amino acid ABC transporter substrate-binding protein [Nostoc linckia FACHB-104]
MTLERQHRRQLHDALISAFPKRQDLERMLLYELDIHLITVTGETDLHSIIREVIIKTDADGRICELICGACRANPGNSELRAIKEKLLPILNREIFPTSRANNPPQRTSHSVSELEEERQEERYKQDYRQFLQDGHPTNDTLHEELRRSSRLSRSRIMIIERGVDKEYESEEREYEQNLSRVIWLFIISGLFVNPRLRSIPPSSKLCDNDLKRIYVRLKRNALRIAIKRAISSAKILLLIALIAFFGFQVDSLIFPPKIQEPSATLPSQPEQKVDISKKISYGEISLFPSDFFIESINKQRTSIIDSFNKAKTAKEYENVVKSFNTYFNTTDTKKRKTNRNDAEALIFKNNAMALARGNPLIIGVSVPIGTSPNVAMEILRGVAQAQNEFNKSNKSNKVRLLQVIIGNDENNEKTVEGIAREFVDKGVLAVIGSNNTTTSLKAAETYDKHNIVMISPTAFGDGFGNKSNALQMVSETSVDGLVKKLGESLSKSSSVKRKILICFDEKSNDSINFIGKFKSGIKQFPQVEINNNYSCRLDAGLDDIRNVLRSASEDGNINAILLAPHIDEEPFKKAIDVAKELKSINENLDEARRIKLFGSPTMNAAYIIKEGGDEVYKAFNDMKVVVPWNPGTVKGKGFLNSAICLWGGDVNWRTAMAFDATNVIINRVRINPGKVDINEIKNDSDSQGVTGTISFSTENRKIEPSIVTFEYVDKSKDKDKDKDSGFIPKGTVTEKECASNS